MSLYPKLIAHIEQSGIKISAISNFTIDQTLFDLI